MLTYQMREKMIEKIANYTDLKVELAILFEVQERNQDISVTIGILRLNLGDFFEQLGIDQRKSIQMSDLWGTRILCLKFCL